VYACSVLFSIRDEQIYITGAIFRPHPNSDANPNHNPKHNFNWQMENNLEQIQLFIHADGK